MVLSAASAVRAAILTETLQNVTFYDGGVATGTFTFDTSTSAITAWSISVSGGNTVSFPALTYGTSNSVASFGAGDLGLPRFTFEAGGFFRDVFARASGGGGVFSSRWPGFLKYDEKILFLAGAPA